ncbi:bifunctional anthranilate synthase component II/anthranilate phosphoribosyltransferase [Priestia taiwanensis]|uniref:Anthranilate phosphoribosyltransferase n=1 Tax=Priestia taiwanensis TaxID=1347902 RepID=A0A917AWP0_9BACI|nr:bifunctional anthranilate synthase component II/anthranilate phosphoribosyltransferase [Priestia taiwanensis]MBM7363354.1 anthranilate phosphoribosyltransferase/anthranilate synthase/phosphoribosyltransferase [Priestia taiwanensis]GGE77838.1 bifunctional protein TrpGD [Priestia taiwanensis]
MIVLIDNYDSFTYNLYQSLRKFTEHVKVVRNDEISLQQLEALQPEAIVLSPGPGRPENAGICVEVIRSFYKKIPILGICLGHQAIGYAFGADIIHAKQIKHGKTSLLTHNQTGIFQHQKQHLRVMRYHSLVLRKETVPSCLDVYATATDDEEIMAVKHKEYLVYGLQFHPESIATEEGDDLIGQFLVEATSTKTMNTYLRKIMEKEDLTEQEAYEASKKLFAEETTESEIAAFLIGLKLKGETLEEVLGLVRVLREKAVHFPKSVEGVLDNCGTGGDKSGSFNISTTSAFVLAGGGVKVAKHGNRSVSSKSGSADVLEHLGVNLTCSPEHIEQLLKEVGIAFLFAPHVHPNLNRIMKVRRELNIPTIFNLIGPLTNPVSLENQMLGIYKRDMMEPIARILHKLGRKRAVVVNGSGYVDEASLQGENHLAILEEGTVRTITLHPHEVGLKQLDNKHIRGGSPKENAAITMRVLNGEEGAYRDTILLNAGIGFFVSGLANSFQEGVELARDSIDSGKALVKLQELIVQSNKIMEEVN